MNSELVLGASESEHVNDPSVLLPSSLIIEPTLTTGSRYSGFITGYCKVGTRVTVHAAVTGLTASTSNYLFTLPEGFRPKGAISTKAGGINVNETGTFTIATNGIVNAVPNATTTLFGTITFEAVQ